MPYELFLALRYLRVRHKRRLARVTGLAAVIGISMGVGALIVALGLSNGFRDEMRNKILQGTAHINVLRTDGYPISETSSVATQIRQVAGVTGASPTTYDGAVVRGSKSSGYAVLRGIEAGSAEAVSLTHWLEAGSLFEKKPAGVEPQAVVGGDLANRLGLSVGDVTETLASRIFHAVDGIRRQRRRLQPILDGIDCLREILAGLLDLRPNLPRARMLRGPRRRGRGRRHAWP